MLEQVEGNVLMYIRHFTSCLALDKHSINISSLLLLLLQLLLVFILLYWMDSKCSFLLKIFLLFFFHCLWPYCDFLTIFSVGFGLFFLFYVCVYYRLWFVFPIRFGYDHLYVYRIIFGCSYLVFKCIFSVLHLFSPPLMLASFNIILVNG